MSPDIQTSSTKICPTCGTRLSENATRCLVCGRSFTTSATPNKTAKDVQSARMPEITLSLPVALGIIAIVLVVGAGAVFGFLRSQGKVVQPTTTVTITASPTVTQTATVTPSPSPMPTFTPLPPIDYAIKLGDMCSSIAAIFNVSIQSIVTLNNLPPDCGVLSVGQKVQIPQPTPTASPMPTSTLSALDATEEACQKLAYEVKENDTLSGIARNYNISIDAIKDYNGLTSDNVLLGTKIIIPLCKRYPTPGPTPTATLPPPYAAPNLLLPADGAVFQAANDTITLQWASVGILRPNEAYAITIEDLTEGTGRKITDYVTDSKYIVPSSFRPTGDSPHIMRWTVIPVRQAGTTTEGKQTWDSAGTRSTFRVFSWWGANVATPTP